MKNRKAVVATLATAILLLAAAVVLPRLAYRPNSGPGVFDSKAAFDAHIAGLGLEKLPLEQAGANLANAGFRCELLAPGNLSCYRKVQGSNCGERQFVDLGAAQGGSPPLRLATRFGLTCN